MRNDSCKMARTELGKLPRSETQSRQRSSTCSWECESYSGSSNHHLNPCQQSHCSSTIPSVLVERRRARRGSLPFSSALLVSSPTSRYVRQSGQQRVQRVRCSARRLSHRLVRPQLKPGACHEQHSSLCRANSPLPAHRLILGYRGTRDKLSLYFTGEQGVVELKTKLASR